MLLLHKIAKIGRMMINNNLLLGCCLSLLIGCQQSVSTETPAWQLSQASSKGLFKVNLMCRAQPSVGPFQDCELQIVDAHNAPIDDAKIGIDGGMPIHGHGLPTAPVANSLNSQGRYRIDGLQYNMPGPWLLGFMIKTAVGQDKVIFNFDISSVEKAACAQQQHLPAS